MVREVFVEEYVVLGREFAGLGLGDEALECASRALRLSPQCTEARELLRAAACLAGEREGIEPPRAAVKRLRERKQRVMEAEASDPSLNGGLVGPVGLRGQDAEADADRGAQDPEEQVAELRHRFDRLRQRLEDTRGERARELLDRMHQLAERLVREQAAKPPAQEHAGDAGETPRGSIECGYGELSIEHEFHNVGNDFYKICRYHDAIDCYNMALELRPDLLETYFNRGLAYTRLERYEKAREDLTKVIELNPKLAEAFYTRGLVWEYEQRYDEAIADYEKALEIDPKYTKAESQMQIAKGKKASLRSDSTPASASSGSSSSEQDRIASFAPYRATVTDCDLSQVGGNHEAKHQLRIVAAFLNGSPAFAVWGCEPPRGVLLYGPPGTGKTLLARALAGEVRCPFYCTPSTIFLNQYYGNTERNIRALWAEAASHPAGAILFIDEAEALLSLRSSLGAPRGDDCHNKAVACMLERMDGMKKSSARVVVIAATNRLENVDPAFLRAGRFNYHIEVPVPTARGLAEIWLIQLERVLREAGRLDSLALGLREAVLGDREGCLDAASRLGRPDGSGVVSLARESARHELVGADVREVVRRCVEERAVVLHEWGGDLGPIAVADLRRHLAAYVADRRERPGGGPDGPGPVRRTWQR